MPKNYGGDDKLTRGLLLGAMLAKGEGVTSAMIHRRFGVSRATAKRDMNVIEATLPVEAEVKGTRVTLSLVTPNAQVTGASPALMAKRPVD